MQKNTKHYLCDLRMTYLHIISILRVFEHMFNLGNYQILVDTPARFAYRRRRLRLRPRLTTPCIMRSTTLRPRINIKLIILKCLWRRNYIYIYVSLNSVTWQCRPSLRLRCTFPGLLYVGLHTSFTYVILILIHVWNESFCKKVLHSESGLI